MKLSGWGHFPIHEAKLCAPRTLAELKACVEQGQAIARGNGRSYGDSAIGVQRTIHMRHFNRMLDFDPDTGVLTAEAGVFLADIIDAFLPRGWFPAVTPGTKFVTLGGMIAADVHGKNHHKDGGLGNFINWIEVMDGGGTVHRCSADQNPELFEWTLGGMGLTGVILRAAMRLRPVQSAWIKQTTYPLRNLDDTLAAFEDHNDANYSVAWIDCLSKGEALGRSVLILGEHALSKDLLDDKARYPFEGKAKRKRIVPFSPPSGLLNRVTVGMFNALYYRNAQRAGLQSLVDCDSFFYPLDAILGWNKIYGRKGFMQFQCVLPLEAAPQGLKELLHRISAAGAGSFLAVLKRMGPEERRISFPMAGYTLALDFPVSEKTKSLMRQLDEITIRNGGRFYLAKDARMSAQTLHRSDPRVEGFAKMREQLGLSSALVSKQSERLKL